MFAGYKQKSFRGVLQNCFLGSVIGRGAKTPFLRCDGTLLRCVFLNTFRSLSWIFSAGLSRLLSTCPKYILWENFSDCARNTSGGWAESFQQSCQNCFLQGVQPNIFGKVFFRFCTTYCKTLWEKVFQPESSNLQFTWPKEHLVNIFPIWAKIFLILSKKISEHLPELLFTCLGECFAKLSLQVFRGKSSAVFSKTAFYIK